MTTALAFIFAISVGFVALCGVLAGAAIAIRFIAELFNDDDRKKNS